MSFPTHVGILSGDQGWDGDIDDNFDIVFDGPFPLHRDAALTEANVQSTFPAAAHDKCFVWVNHSVFGYTLYFSDGTNWRVYGWEKRITSSVTGAVTLNGRERMVMLSGSPPYTVTLAPAASWKGETVTFKLLVAGGTVTLDANAAETIDGALTYTGLSAQYAKVVLYSDGTSIHVIG